MKYKENEKSYLKNIRIYLGLIFFLILLFLASYKLNPFNGLLSYSDQSYKFNTEISTWGQYLGNGLNRDQTMFLVLPNSVFIYFLSIFGLNDYWISYFIWIIPIILCFITFQYTIFKISKDEFLAFTIGILVIFSNLSFQYIRFYSTPYFLSLIAIAIIIYQTYLINQNNKINNKNMFLIVLTTILAFHPFFLIVILSYLLFFFIFYLIKNFSKTNIIKSSIIILLVLIINFYWLIPFLGGLLLQKSSENTYTSGNLDAVFEGYANQVSVINIMYGWEWPAIATFLKYNPNNLNIIFTLSLWIFIFLSISFNKKKENKLFLSFLIVCLFLFFNLALGPKNPLLGKVWLFFWNNFSFFKFFRSFSRFSIIIIPLAGFILAIFYKKEKYYKFILIGLLISVILAQLPIFSGDYAGTIRSFKIPSEYTTLNNKILGDQEIYSIISYPYMAYEAYDWNKNRIFNEFPLDNYFQEYFFNKNIIYNKAAFSLNERYSFYEKLFPKVYDKNLLDYLNETNCKYILLHNDSIDWSKDINKTVNIQNILNLLDENNYTLKDSNKYFYLYINKNYLSLIYSNNNLNFKKINDAKYKVYLNNLTNKPNITILTNFDSRWKLYLVKHPTNSWCKEIEFYNNTNTTECEHTQTFFEGEELSYLYKKPVFESTHKMIYDYANSWTIDPEYIKDNFSKDYYTENPDGSINIELVMYFKPQSYFYLGLLISISTILICLSYLLSDYIFSRRTRKEFY